jgi:predicted MPP superfamily phosphohydrolase
MAMSPWMRVFCVLAMADLMIWWVAWRTLGRSPHAWKWASACMHLFFAFMVADVGALMFGREYHVNVDVMVPRVVTVAVFIWHLLMVPLVFAGIIVAAICSLVGKVIRLFRRPGIGATGAGLTRREFFARLCLLTPPALTVLLTMVAEQQLKGFRIRRITVTLPGLPAALDGMTITNVADVHTGRFTHGDILGRIAAATNELRADLVLFAGDLINDSLAWLDDGIAMLKKINRPLVVIEGNHDLFENEFEFRQRVKASGLNFLVNETATITVRGVPVQILGMAWGTDSKRPSRMGEPQLADLAAPLLKLRDPAAFPILLAHHPHAWDYVSGIPLTISGHTHGGQLMVTEHFGFGPAMFRYWSGLYTRKVGHPQDEGEALVVSNGTGNWFPLRTRAPAEIIHITLKRGVV